MSKNRAKSLELQRREEGTYFGGTKTVKRLVFKDKTNQNFDVSWTSLDFDAAKEKNSRATKGMTISFDNKSV